MSRHTLPRSAPASINTTAASPWPDSIAKCNGVFPTLSPVFNLVFGLPGGGFRRMVRNAVEPVVAARCLNRIMSWYSMYYETSLQWVLICFVLCIDLMGLVREVSQREGCGVRQPLVQSRSFLSIDLLYRYLE